MLTACAEPERAPDQGDERCCCSQCELEVPIVLEHGGKRTWDNKKGPTLECGGRAQEPPDHSTPIALLRWLSHTFV